MSRKEKFEFNLTLLIYFTVSVSRQRYPRERRPLSAPLRMFLIVTCAVEAAVFTGAAACDMRRLAERVP